MGIIISADIGGSATKVAGYRETGEQIGKTIVRLDDQVASFYGAFGKFSEEHAVALSEIQELILTGVGASRLSHNQYDLPVTYVEEFEAIGRGGLLLSGVKEAVVVSMGTGTAFVHASEAGCTHLGGSGIGGGTLLGLSKLLLNETDISAVARLAQEGVLEHADITIRDICQGEVPGLPPHATASNFGKVRNALPSADTAAALINMILQGIGSMAMLAAHGIGTGTVVLTGSLASLPQAKGIYETFREMYHLDFLLPEDAEYATAYGAFATRMHEMPSVAPVI